jgi:hypothetical protein
MALDRRTAQAIRVRIQAVRSSLDLLERGLDDLAGTPAQLDQLQRDLNRQVAALARAVTLAGLEGAQREVTRYAPYEDQPAAEAATRAYPAFVAESVHPRYQGQPDVMAYRNALVHGRRPSLREAVLAVLSVPGVPVTPRTVSEVALAGFNVQLPVRLFASLRRDERRAFDSGVRRESLVVPAIDADTFLAIPRLITSSSWALGRRLIGSLSLRANHLRLIAALADLVSRRYVEVAGHAPGVSPTDPLAELIGRYAETVKDAIIPGTPPDPAHIANVALAELEGIGRADQEEREAAAARLAALPRKIQLWGREDDPGRPDHQEA